VPYLNDDVLQFDFIFIFCAFEQINMDVSVLFFRIS
jgi:hypothetical protein